MKFLGDLVVVVPGAPPWAATLIESPSIVISPELELPVSLLGLSEPVMLAGINYRMGGFGGSGGLG